MQLFLIASMMAHAPLWCTGSSEAAGAIRTPHGQSEVFFKGRRKQWAWHYSWTAIG
jgi:hypothetical protein